MNTEETAQGSCSGTSFRGAAAAGRRERAFELVLPALVSGEDAAGKRFKERTAISSISAQEILFRLNARLLAGSRIVIDLEVPRTLILEKPLRLLLSGSVDSARAEDGRGKHQTITARLDRSYKLIFNS
jgi:hypothetical protein